MVGQLFAVQHCIISKKKFQCGLRQEAFPKFNAMKCGHFSPVQSFIVSIGRNYPLLADANDKLVNFMMLC